MEGKLIFIRSATWASIPVVAEEGHLLRDVGLSITFIVA